MKITDGTGKGMEVKPGWIWQREWEFEWTVGNARKWDWKRHSRSSLLYIPR